jgi:predicted metal-dependent hydrolase
MLSNVNGQLCTVTVEYKRNRNMYLRVGNDGTLHVTAPYGTSQEIIDRFIQEKSNWILKTMAALQVHQSEVLTGEDHKEAAWMGKHYSTSFIPASSSFLLIEEETRKMTFFLKEDTPQEIRKTFYQEGNKLLAKMIQERRGDLDQVICEANHKPKPRITLRYTTSQWGSCTPSRNRISISSRLIHFPSDCLDYVLLHEYAHILVPNHSKAFYDVVERYMPDWKTSSDKLR